MDKDLSIFIISLLDKSKRLKKHLELDGAFLSAALLCSFCGFFLFLVALPLVVGKGYIVFRFILEYSSLRDSGP
jgi:hypothetical protein